MLWIIAINLRESNNCDADLTSLLATCHCKTSCKYKALSEKNAVHVQLHNVGSFQSNTNILAGITANREEKYPSRHKYS